MNRIVTLFSLIICCVLYTSAASTLSESQQTRVIAKINASASKMKSMRCTFIQTKYLSLLSDKMVSSGKMYYQQPNKLRWEYISPYNYLFVFNSTKVYVGNKTKNDVIDTNTNKVFKEIARIMMNTVTGKALSNTRDFSISVSANNTSWVVTLIPKKKEMKQMFSKIELIFNKSTIMISEINIFEKNNDRTNIKLSNIETHGTINESLFAIP